MDRYDEHIGKSVRLVPLTLAHTDALFEASTVPEIWAYMPQKVFTPQEMADFVTRALEAQKRGTDIPYVVIHQETNGIVGTTRYLHISSADRHLEIGWTFYHPSVWRTRVNTECKYLLLKHAFEKMDVIRVQFCVDSRNQRSQQAVLRLGASAEGVLRKHRILSDGYVRDTCVFSILQEEWPVVKRRLEAYLDDDAYRQ